MKKLILILSFCILLPFIYSCDEDFEFQHFNEIYLKKIIHSSNSSSGIGLCEYEYNSSKLIVKESYTNDNTDFPNNYENTYSYDSLGRIIRSNINNHLYNLFKYDGNLVTKLVYSKDSNDEWINNYKEILTLNSESLCVKLISYHKDEYGDWEETGNNTYIWENGNLKESHSKIYGIEAAGEFEYENYAESVRIYEYDQYYNPNKLLTYSISPLDKSTNNVIRSKYFTRFGLDFSETKIFNNNDIYRINDYGYVVECVSTLNSFTAHTRYEYEIY